MTEKRFERMQRLFLAASELPEDQQRDWLQIECGDDSELLSDVRQLIAESGRDHDPLEHGLVEIGGSEATPFVPSKAIERFVSSLETTPNGHVVNRRLGDYQVIREIGRGGMGIVYEANHHTLDRRVALKVLAGPAVGNHRERFFREARAAARLHHTNIVPVFDFGEDEGVAFYAMQFIEGRGLDELVRWVRQHQRDVDSSGSLSAFWQQLGPANTGDDSSDSSAATPKRWRYIAQLGAQAADALQYAHRHGVVHRDIKPSNLLLDDNHHLWITDFGLAKLADDGDLTARGELVGTLRYLAPEALRGTSDKLTDVYGLGLVLYELIVTDRPFEETDRLGLLQLIADQGPKPIADCRSDVPGDLRVIVQKAIERDPQLRYQSAGELAEDLRRFVDQKPISARRTSWLAHALSWARRNRMTAMLLLSLAACLTLGLVASIAFNLHLNRVVDARSQRLFEAKLNEAASLRASELVGQRFQAMSSIREASELLSQLQDATSAREQLQTELIGALGLADVRLISERDAGDIPDWWHVYHHDARLLAYATQDASQVRVRNVDNWKIVRQSEDGQRTCSCVKISPNGHWLAWTRIRAGTTPARNEWELVVHDLRINSDALDEGTRVFLHGLRGRGAFGFDERDQVALLDTQGDLIIHHLAAQREVNRMDWAAAEDSLVAISRDSKRVAVVKRPAGGKEAHTLEAWDAASGELLFAKDLFELPSAMSWNHDGSEIALTVDWRSDIWNVATGQRRLRLHDQQPPTELAYTADGAILITSGWGPFTSFTIAGRDVSSRAAANGTDRRVGAGRRTAHQRT